MPVLLALSTVPDMATGERIARCLVEEQLAACVNLVPGLTSIYRWNGRVENATEVLLLIKSTTEAWKELQSRVQSLHPYELPELIAVEVDSGLDPYLRWVKGAVISVCPD